MATTTTPDLLRLLAEGKDYFWALRHTHERNLTPERREELRALLASEGIDEETLKALRALEPSFARGPHASVVRPRHDEYQRFDLADFHIYFNGALCERGLDAGVELFPVTVDWTFCHDEIQYCTGGDTPIDVTLPSNKVEHKRVRAGDVMAIPLGAHMTFHSSEEDGRFGHAHIFVMNLGGPRGEVWYDVGDVRRLRTMGLVEARDEAPLPFHDLAERIEVKEWSRLLEVGAEHERERDLPTWLRNGWARREETRLLDYHERTDALVISSPDRLQADYLPWGEGVRRCFVNPIVAEATAAICDTHFPAGYARLNADRELWAVLRGAARVTQSVPPLHGEWVEHEVSEGELLAVAGAANVKVLDASDDFVVRRLAESAASNQHARIMELKLEADGVHREL
jgi:hypothetical protein